MPTTEGRGIALAPSPTLVFGRKGMAPGPDLGRVQRVRRRLWRLEEGIENCYFELFEVGSLVSHRCEAQGDVSGNQIRTLGC